MTSLIPPLPAAPAALLRYLLREAPMHCPSPSRLTVAACVALVGLLALPARATTCTRQGAVDGPDDPCVTTRWRLDAATSGLDRLTAERDRCLARADRLEAGAVACRVHLDAVLALPTAQAPGWRLPEGTGWVVAGAVTLFAVGFVAGAWAGLAAR